MPAGPEFGTRSARVAAPLPRTRREPPPRLRRRERSGPAISWNPFRRDARGSGGVPRRGTCRWSTSSTTPPNARFWEREGGRGRLLTRPALRALSTRPALRATTPRLMVAAACACAEQAERNRGATTRVTPFFSPALSRALAPFASAALVASGVAGPTARGSTAPSGLSPSPSRRARRRGAAARHFPSDANAIANAWLASQASPLFGPPFGPDGLRSSRVASGAEPRVAPFFDIATAGYDPLSVSMVPRRRRLRGPPARRAASPGSYLLRVHAAQRGPGERRDAERLGGGVPSEDRGRGGRARRGVAAAAVAEGVAEGARRDPCRDRATGRSRLGSRRPIGRPRRRRRRRPRRRRRRRPRRGGATRARTARRRPRPTPRRTPKRRRRSGGNKSARGRMKRYARISRGFARRRTFKRRGYAKRAESSRRRGVVLKRGRRKRRQRRRVASSTSRIFRHSRRTWRSRSRFWRWRTRGESSRG